MNGWVKGGWSVKSSQATQNISNASLPYLADRGIDCFLQEGDLYREIDFASVAQKTTRDLLAELYVFRFDISGHGKVYFVEDEGLFFKLQEEGKNVRWLHDLFEGWRQELIRQGLPPYTSTYWWSLEDIHTFVAAFRVFPGAKVVYQGPVGNWEVKHG